LGSGKENQEKAGGGMVEKWSCTLVFKILTGVKVLVRVRDFYAFSPRERGIQLLGKCAYSSW
jgi:hypothetical protein